MFHPTLKNWLLLLSLALFTSIAQADEAAPVNLLAPARGGQLISSPNANWKNIITGGERTFMWTWAGQEGVFAFKDEKPATFHRFEIQVPLVQAQNPREIELLVSDDSADGPFKSLGRFTVQNQVRESQYQSFILGKITTRYFKLRILSNYGGMAQGNGNTQMFQIRLISAP